VVEAGLETLVSFTEIMMASNHEAGTSYLNISTGKMTREEVDLFQVPTNTPKIIVERVRTLDGNPAMYSIHVSPKTLLGEAPIDRYRGSLFALLEQQSGLRMSHSDTHIYSTLAGEDIARMLGIRADAPLLVLDELVYSTDGQLMCTSLSYFRADIHHYRIVRKRPDTAVLA
jgi:DNA-binding GntR family transcriptional regulator